jgi:hypothetical protein
MDDYKQEEVTNHPRLDPTLPAGSDPYTDPLAKNSTEKGVDYYSTPYTISMPPPPPWWNTKKAHPVRRYLPGICTFLIGCIVGASVLFLIRQLFPTVVSPQNTTTVQ